MTNQLFACTSLVVRDKSDNLYHGRTMEFQTEDPESVLIYYPKGHEIQYTAPDGSNGLKYTVNIPYMGITLPMEGDHFEEQYYSVDGVNAEGLAYSMNMLPDSKIKDLASTQYSEALPIVAIGDWALGQFAMIEEFRDKVLDLNFWSPILSNFNDVVSPFHYAFYDKTGASIAVEITNGVLSVKDNPTLCMTNGPRLEWHLTNLNNYTHLTNVDVNTATLGNMNLAQPDSGIATVSLPNSDTSVGRFVRAVYYTTYCHKEDSPEKQMIELSHIMNKFDRPKFATMDRNNDGEIETEYAVWTALTDMTRGEVHIRHYNFINYKTFTLEQFKDEKQPIRIPVDQ